MYPHDMPETEMSPDNVFTAAQSKNLLAVYETALRNTPDFVYIISTDNRFLYANRALLETWGRTFEEMIGRTFIDLGYEQWHADMHIREIETIIRTKKPFRSEIPFTGTQGKRIYDYIFSPVLGEDGSVIAIAGTTRDVTERKEIEDALRLSHERAKLTLEASEFLGIWNWDLRTNLVVADERFAELYSVDPGRAASGAPIEEYTKMFHPDDAARLIPVITETAIKGGEFHEEYRVLRPDGSLRWVVARGRAHLDADGKPLRFAGAVVDITERKFAEEKLKESQRQLTLLTDALPQQVWTTRPDGQLDYVNEFTIRYVGDIPVKDGIVEWTSAIHPSDLASSMERWGHSVATGEPYETQQRIRHVQSGKFRWNLSRAVAIRDEAGNIKKWFGTNTDIEEQKQAEDTLREKDFRLRTALQAGRMGTWELDVETSTLTCSKTCNANYGLSQEEELSYEKLLTLVHAEDREHWNRVVADAIQTGSEFEMEYRAIWPDGSIHWIYVRGDCTAASEKIARMLSGVSINITERKQLELTAREAQKNAEAANIAKSEFLANMSHEIRTPMNAVIGLSTILSKSEGLTPKQKEYIHTLQLSADSLLSLINDLLDISKIEARSIELEHIPFNVTQLLNEVISIMSVRAREKGLEFTALGNCERPRIVMGDPVRLRQVILNLCSNAIKFTEKGSVQVSITCVPSEKAGTEILSISVADTGIGITADKQGTIFQKFVQADSSINRKYGGTGLGLAITKTLTEIMNGTITLKSVPNEGSIFTVTLPVETGDHEADMPLSSQRDEQHPDNEKTRLHRVLLVEDYAANVLVAASYLDLFGYAYDVVDNGYEAVQKAKSGTYLAILMDVQMHGMNGFEATQLIRADEKKEGRPRSFIIGMTAHALAGDRERCLGADMDDYLSKPYNPEELKGKLTACEP